MVVVSSPLFPHAVRCAREPPQDSLRGCAMRVPPRAPTTRDCSGLPTAPLAIGRSTAPARWIRSGPAVKKKP